MQLTTWSEFTKRSISVVRRRKFDSPSEDLIQYSVVISCHGTLQKPEPFSVHNILKKLHFLRDYLHFIYYIMLFATSSGCHQSSLVTVFCNPHMPC